MRYDLRHSSSPSSSWTPWLPLRRLRLYTSFLFLFFSSFLPSFKTFLRYMNALLVSNFYTNLAGLSAREMAEI